MIFSLGLLLYVIALVAESQYTKGRESPYWVAVVGVAGVALMLLSIGMLAWDRLP